MPKAIVVDDDVYNFLASQTQNIGESASDILRRLLKIHSSRPCPRQFPSQGSSVGPSPLINAASVPSCVGVVNCAFSSASAVPTTPLISAPATPNISVDFAPIPSPAPQSDDVNIAASQIITSTAFGVGHTHSSAALTSQTQSCAPLSTTIRDTTAPVVITTSSHLPSAGELSAAVSTPPLVPSAPSYLCVPVGQVPTINTPTPIQLPFSTIPAGNENATSSAVASVSHLGAGEERSVLAVTAHKKNAHPKPSILHARGFGALDPSNSLQRGSPSEQGLDVAARASDEGASAGSSSANGGEATGNFGLEKETTPVVVDGEFHTKHVAVEDGDGIAGEQGVHGNGPRVSGGSNAPSLRQESLERGPGLLVQQHYDVATCLKEVPSLAHQCIFELGLAIREDIVRHFAIKYAREIRGEKLKVNLVRARKLYRVLECWKSGAPRRRASSLSVEDISGLRKRRNRRTVKTQCPFRIRFKVINEEALSRPGEPVILKTTLVNYAHNHSLDRVKGYGDT